MFAVSDTVLDTRVLTVSHNTVWVFPKVLYGAVFAVSDMVRDMWVLTMSHNTMMNVSLGVCCKVLCLMFQTWYVTDEC